ncbi:ParB/RepB/Spo0J family partition protein [Pseudomonas sp. SWRI79]|uniref:ParB/RepB/Spo0J family partition protein n=1 Tax=Pseudomonas farris TaxID=2841207 RepID=A0ABS6Q1P1_9PSED|nr:ParB/RepB/Spo0J family partition protein [Pseudomonas farris]MBV4466641.1 ParB/RepB/Spo0J family partition protein [Pseudomonas farris]
MAALDIVAPIIVKPILGTEYYQIYQGHNRAKIAQKNGDKFIDVIVAPPDFLTRNRRLQEAKIKRNPKRPLDALKIVKSDTARKDSFYREASYFQQNPRLNTHRGTLISLDIEVKFFEETVLYKSLPLKGGFGAIIFSPAHAKLVFDLSVIDEDKIMQAWGTEDEYDATVLPAYIEVGSNTVDYRGGGFAHDVSFRVEDSPIFIPPRAEERPRVVSVISTVVYPDGNMWRGPIVGPDDDIAAIVWSDELTNCLLDKEQQGAFRQKNWWNTPTSIVFGKKETTMRSVILCGPGHHACGSTCHGGGCLV